MSRAHPPIRLSLPPPQNKPQYAGTYLATMDYCGGPYAAYPEEFW